MILGDSLLVMNSLAEKEGLRGQVQMIYIDPPYGINFGSNWQVSTRRTTVKDGKAEDATRQPEQVRAFRDTWEHGTHSYLAYLRDRLLLARELLAESGSVFLQIGDDNVHLVRCLMDEVFGSDNFVSLISFNKSSGLGSVLLPRANDYIVWYSKEISQLKYRQLYQEKSPGADGAGRYNSVRQPDGTTRPATAAERAGQLADGARLFTVSDLTKPGPGRQCSITFEGRTYRPEPRWWGFTPEGFDLVSKSGRVVATGKTISFMRFLNDFPAYPINNVWIDIGGIMSRSDPKVYVVQTSTAAIANCVLMTTDPGDLVLDPTCGSGTTAYVAEQWGRRWITVETSRVAITLARTRLMAGRFPFYLISDTPEGISKEAEVLGKERPRPMPRTEGDIRKGFVCKRVPHVTLKTIANNEEIDAIHGKWQECLEPLRAKLNKLVKKKWEEWEIPREPADAWSKEAKAALREWWQLRRNRQEEIDASISRHSDTEILYDQPHEDKKRIRVTGPFTVESLSPHRTISVEEKKDLTIDFDGAKHPKVYGPDKFGQMIIENLRKAGVQNTKKNERLKFDSLEPYAGEWIHAEGRYTEKDGSTRRAAVTIGPEYGTVGPELLKEAAKEAVQGIGFDLLIICGFAFDPHVSEEVKRYGKLVVLPCRMNPDLSMGDELLKKTGAGNLFMVFGEPDLEVTTAKNGQIVVEIRGVDVYDPTTGEIRSSSTDDIACWLLDTNYNGESFFVRHAYFTGGDEPYEKLKRALRAEIDEDAWSQLYSTTSRPFPKPETGKIAVKVINHYGDEVLKVYGM